MRLTVLADNAALPGFEKEWGLSMLLDTPDGRVLWDMGQGPAMAANAKALGIDLGAFAAVGLSHGHFDHGDGLPRLIAAGYDGPVYAHPNTLAGRYGLKPDGARVFIGLSEDASQGLAARLVPVDATASLVPGLTMVSAIARRPGAHQSTKGLFCDEKCCRGDNVPDDAFLVWEKADSAVVIFGCCHAGLANSLERARELTGGKPIEAVVGGLHLFDADAAILEQSATALEAAAPARILAGHCTGEKAIDWLAKRFPGRVEPLAAGQVIEL